MRIIQYDLELTKERIPQLVKEKGFNYATTTELNQPALIVNMMKEVYHLERKAEEHLYILALDTKNKPIAVFEISKGTVNASLVSPREILIRMLLCGCVGMVLIHNHPSGSTQPSTEDIRVKDRLKESANLIGIELLDSIIIAAEQYLSFQEQKIM